MKNCENCDKVEVCTFWEDLTQDTEKQANMVTGGFHKNGDLGDPPDVESMDDEQIDKFCVEAYERRDKNEADIKAYLGGLKASGCTHYNPEEKEGEVD